MIESNEPHPVKNQVKRVKRNVNLFSRLSTAALMHMSSGGKAPRILNLVTRYKWVVILHPGLFTPVPFRDMLVAPIRQSGRGGEI
jgi:hypothetical protein